MLSWPVIALAVLIVGGIIVLMVVFRRALTGEIDIDRKVSVLGATCYRCHHCQAVITQRNRREHGRNCAQRGQS